jgi:hypothetical protein
MENRLARAAVASVVGGLAGVELVGEGLAGGAAPLSSDMIKGVDGREGLEVDEREVSEEESGDGGDGDGGGDGAEGLGTD